MLLLQKDYDSLKAQMIVTIFLAIKNCHMVCMLFFRYNAINTLNRLYYSVSITFICTGKQKNSYDLLYCNICFTVMVFSISEVSLYEN